MRETDIGIRFYLLFKFILKFPFFFPSKHVSICQLLKIMRAIMFNCAFFFLFYLFRLFLAAEAFLSSR